MDNTEGWKQTGWFRQVPVSEFAHHFAGWTYDWLDVPALIAGADGAYENPMIDRDPVPDLGRRPGGAAGRRPRNAMYPTGSNGASQAIVDARVLGTCLLAHGVTPAALAAYDVETERPDLTSHSAQPWRPVRSDCSIWSTSAAAGSSPISTTSSTRRARPPSWPLQEGRGLRDRAAQRRAADDRGGGENLVWPPRSEAPAATIP